MLGKPKLNLGYRGPNDFIAKIIIARAAPKKISYIFVEGKDDIAAFQKHCVLNCKIQELNSRENVIKLIQEASREEYPAGSGRKGIDGILGIVDRDWTDFIKSEDPLPNRVVVLPELNDLESLVLYHLGYEVLSGIIRDTNRNISSWHDESQNKQPFEMLINNIVSPLGALRVAWQTSAGTSNHKLDDPNDMGRVTRLAWEIGSKSPGVQINPLQLLNKIFEGRNEWYANENKQKLIALKADEYLAKHSTETEAWKLVKGKDLVNILAHSVLASKAELAIYETDNLSKIRERIKMAITAQFNRKLISECELDKSVAKATKSDTVTFEYFLPAGTGLQAVA